MRVEKKMRIKNLGADMLVWLGGAVFLFFLGLLIFLSVRKWDRKIYEYEKPPETENTEVIMDGE
jgi:hypothetical protein